MIKSLNKAYEDDEFIYMCNSCGDINVPDKPAEVGDISLLTLKEKMFPQPQRCGHLLKCYK